MTQTRRQLTFFRALDSFVGGIAFVLTTPRIWAYAIVPAAMLVALMFVVTGFGIWGAAELSLYIFGPARGTWGDIGYWCVTTLLAVIAFLIAIVLALLLAEPLSGHALIRVAQAQELMLTGAVPLAVPWLKSLWLSTCAVTVALAFGGTALIALFAINVLYPPAMVVTVPLKLVVCGWMLAWDFLDYPLGMRGLGILARFGWVFRNFGAFTLFGICWALLAMVPGVVLVLLPMGVAGATRMVLIDEQLR